MRMRTDREEVNEGVQDKNADFAFLNGCRLQIGKDSRPKERPVVP